MTGQPPLLEFQATTLRFGGLTAVSALDLKVPEGALHGMIGPNGAGKTTVFNLATGIYTPSEGRVCFAGQVVAEGKGPGRGGRSFRRKPYELAARGMTRTFQNIRLFRSLTVLDNVRTALQQRLTTGLLGAVLRLPGFAAEEAGAEAEARSILEVLGLAEVAGRLARTLPYGEQRRVEIARALATRPRILLLDEPAAGMNPSEKARLLELLQLIRSRFSLTILMIEHDMRFVMGVCEHISVLDYGVKIAEGSPDEVRRNPAVIEAYLGEAPA